MYCGGGGGVRVGLTDAELEEERMAEMERVMRSDAEMREQRERAAAEDALLRAARQDDWVQRLFCCAVHLGLLAIDRTPYRARYYLNS